MKNIKNKRESEHGSRYFHQADVVRQFATEYYESCFDDEQGLPFDPDEQNKQRIDAASKLFEWVKDIYEEALGCDVNVQIIGLDDLD